MHPQESSGAGNLVAKNKDEGMKGWLFCFLLPDPRVFVKVTSELEESAH